MSTNPVFPVRRSKYRDGLPDHVQPPSFMTPDEINRVKDLYNGGTPWCAAVNQVLRSTELHGKKVVPKSV